MEENTKPEQVVTPTAPPPVRTRNKVIERVKLKLTGAGSCAIEDVIVKKNEIIELEPSRSERFLKSGLFVRV